PPPRGAGAASVLRLQRAVGNARVQRALVAPGGAVQRQAEAPAAEPTDYNLVLGIPGREPEQHRAVSREAALEALRGFRRQVLSLVEGGREGHRYMTRVREDQYVVGLVSDVLGGFRSLPGMEIWQEPLTSLALADAALAEGDVAAGARLLKQAAAGWRKAQDLVTEYTEGTISGAGRAEVVLEVTAVLGGVAASLVTGGAASGLLLGTAYAATQTVARQGSELSLGMRDRIDWAGVTFDALFSLVTSKLGGKLGESILKRLLARPEVASLGRRVLAESLSELLSGQAIASLHMAARTVFDNLRGAGAPVTVGQFLEQLGAHLTDPRSMFYDLLLGHVQRKLHGRAEASRAARRGAATPPPPEMESAALRAPDAPAPDAPAALAAAGPEPASRTMAGSDVAPRPRSTTGGAESEPLHEMMAREGIRRDLAEPAADGPGLRPHTDYARGVGDPAEAYALYNRALGEAGGKQEVAIFRSERDGGYTVRVGDHGSVRSPSGDGWTAVLHFHPNRTAAERFFLPAPADFQDVAARRGDGGRTAREFIEFHVPGVGRGRAEYGADPSGDRPFYVTTHHPDGTTHTVRFRDVDEFRGYWESHHVAAAPGSELDAALRADVDAYLAGRRQAPAEGERTMAGDARGGRRLDYGEVELEPDTGPAPELDPGPQPTRHVQHGEVELPPDTGPALELDTGPRPTRPVQHREIDPGGPIPKFKRWKKRKPRFGAPTGELEGTGRGKGMHYRQYDAAEVAYGVRVDYDGGGRPKSVGFRIDADVADRTAQTDRAFTRNETVDAAQSSDKGYNKSGYERGHLVQREAVRGDAAVERAADQWTGVVPMTEALNRGAGSPWRASEERAIQWAVRYGHVTVQVEPVYDATPPTLKDGTPIPKAIRRAITAPDGTVLEDITHLNR
ncbi:MAG: DNA/RNA non-specific endonuclease, partial [Gemmatimonadota bacterium]